MSLYHIFILLYFLATFYHVAPFELPSFSETPITVERSRAFTLLLSCLQCISETDEATAEIREINRNFNPEEHIHEYVNKNEVRRLLLHIKDFESQPWKLTESFTFTPASVDELDMILDALYPTSSNWPLFFNTSAWLIGRVNGARLQWAFSVIAGEKFMDSVVTPTAVEIFPQLYINKVEVAKVAGITVTQTPEEFNPLSYYINDPRLHEFHWNWHVDNPFIWIETKFYKVRDRKGELLLYLHKQLLSRYNGELASNRRPFVTSLELQPDFIIPEPYYPDIVNINFEPFLTRYEGQQMKDYDGITTHDLADLQTWYDRLSEGIKNGFLLRENGFPEFLWNETHGSDTLGAQAGDYNPTVNKKYYGILHSKLHRFLAGMARVGLWQNAGVTSHPETTIRDRVFYRLHSKLDELYQELKTHVGAYKPADLNYPGIEISSVDILTTQPQDVQLTPTTPTLTTYFDWDTFDIFTTARPCRGINGAPALTKVKTLRHHAFSYSISIKSTLSTKAYGMVRIFLLPEVDFSSYQGKPLSKDESHQNAIQLDVFPLKLKPNEVKTIVRSSENSSITRRNIPGIKTLYNVTSPSPDGILQPDMKRACGFPSNLLIPKGTSEGLGFKLFIMISKESESEEELKTIPHWPYCGMLNGLPYVDKRSMGYPFDRPGSKFDLGIGDDGEFTFKNVKEIPILIKHLEEN